GISYASISLKQDPAFPSDPTKQLFDTDNSHSTVEVLNLFLGSGNDHLDVQSTLIPGPDHNSDGTLGFVSEHGGLTTVHGGGNSPIQMTASIAPDNAFNVVVVGLPVGTGQLVRTDGQSWSDAGFAVGQQVMLSIDIAGGSVTGSYTVTDILNQPLRPGSILVLLGASGA